MWLTHAASLKRKSGALNRHRKLWIAEDYAVDMSPGELSKDLEEGAFPSRNQRTSRSDERCQ